MIPTAIWASSIPAVITVIGTLLGVYFQNRSLHKKTKKESEENMALVTYKIEELSKKQDKYNNLQERMAKMETAVSVLDERQRTANHRIQDLEDKEKSYGKRETS